MVVVFLNDVIDTWNVFSAFQFHMLKLVIKGIVQIQSLPGSYPEVTI